MLSWQQQDPLAVPRCVCGHALHHHVRDGGLTGCQHPGCGGECPAWAEDRQVEAA